MPNETIFEAPTVQLRHALRSLLGSVRDLGRAGLLFAVLALCAGRAGILGDVYPFGPALVTALLRAGRRSEAAAAIAAILAGLASNAGVARAGGALFFYAILYVWAKRAGADFRTAPPWAGAVAIGGLYALAQGAAGAAAAALFGWTLLDPVTPWVEGALAAVLVVVADPWRAVWQVENTSAPPPLAVAEAVGAALALAVVGLGLADLRWGGVNLAEVWARWLTVIAAAVGGASVGTALGAVLGLFLALDGMRLSGGIAVLTVSGLLAGLFSRRGKLGAGFGFALGHLAVSFQALSAAEVRLSLASAGVALACFLAVSPRALKRLGVWLPPRKGLPIDAGPAGGALRQPGSPRLGQAGAGLPTPSARPDRLQRAIEERLCALSGLLGEMARTFENAPETQPDGHQSETSQFVDAVGKSLCRRCTGFRRCWQENFYDSYWGLVEFAAAAAGKEAPSPRDLPEKLAARCFQSHKLVSTAVQALQRVELDGRLISRLAQARQIIPRQLDGLAELIEQMAGEFTADPGRDQAMEALLAPVLRRRRYGVAAVRVLVIGADRREVTCDLSQPCATPGACGSVLAPVVSKLLGRTYEVHHASCLDAGGGLADPAPKPYRRGRAPDRALRSEGAGGGAGAARPACRVILWPQPPYELRLEVGGAPQSVNAISGDAFTAVELAGGRTALILSDGMGQGAAAALESQATVGLLRRLFEAGFSAEFALPAVNSVLVLRSTAERFATVDVALIDRFSGVAEFYKIGSPPTFIKRGAHVEVLRSASIPVGILNRIEISAQRMQLRHDDLFVLLTDGALDAAPADRGAGAQTAEGRLAAWLRSNDGLDPRDVAAFLMQSGPMPKRLIPEDDRECRSDDRTVVAAQLILRESIGSASRAPEIPEYRRAR